MWLYKQVVLLTVYQLWPCNNKNLALFSHQSSAVFFNQFLETLLDPAPNYQTKHTAAVALVDPGAKSTQKKSVERKTPRDKWRKNGNLNKFTTFITKYLQMQSNASFAQKRTYYEIAASQRLCFRISCFKLPLMSKRQKWHQIHAFAEINPNPYYVGQRLPSETLSNKNHANRHLKELFGVIRSTIDPHLPLSKQPNQTQTSQFSVQPFTSTK